MSSYPSAPYFVLCVDDEPSGLTLRQLILERKGYLVATARTASEDLALFKAGDFDLVVTDHLLGRDTGTAMAKEMKLLRSFVPIIVLSGATDTPDSIEIVDAFLSKAEGVECLLAKVREFPLRSRAARADSNLKSCPCCRAEASISAMAAFPENSRTLHPGWRSLMRTASPRRSCRALQRH